jgi:diadenosine tetraphosphate (Ap4A) HIT family hydrolase
VPGHTLIIPRRHVGSVFDLTHEELLDLHALVVKARERLLKDLHPDAFNIGLNDGPAAGQTVPHAHIHLIPRKTGDVPDPRGGVRWIIPAKAKYWMP